MIFKEETKSIPITKMMVWEAYKQVKRNKGAAGVDAVSLEAFDQDRSKLLYKLWNRLASGAYFPQHVRRVEIPKGDGKTRPLGIPAVSDRIAQQVVKNYLEPRLEQQFLDCSYGYRPARSAHQAIQEVRKHVLRNAWVIDLDVQSFFEDVDHALLYRALEKHVQEKWVMLYIKRWLETPIQLNDGSIILKEGKGTPQGGVISPLLANLYLHYTMDKWMQIHHPAVKLVRYADDMIIHCHSQRQAEFLLSEIRERFKACGLKLHPEKTKIVYCKKDGRGLNYNKVQFDFLSFSFRPMSKKLKRGGHFLQFDCTVSRKAKLRMINQIRALRIRRKTGGTIQQIAQSLNDTIRGWVNYYGKVRLKGLSPVFYYLHQRLMSWAMNKFKNLKGSRRKAANLLKRIANDYPNLFYHWPLGYSFLWRSV
ncbi:group II intron reverse transcriptase/maturase [Persicobacter diffluens]|uniref:Group II intron reverse transcriptase/maturase n=1 Tax=Persicobacter diffluens TaxID=981 RepID=A0AAN4VW51_9BACT|nr:group II intron reverse transcriptase/maturase [Persicobacter diffluens]